jgi:hypothetical protein
VAASDWPSVSVVALAARATLSWAASLRQNHFRFNLGIKDVQNRCKFWFILYYSERRENPIKIQAGFRSQRDQFHKVVPKRFYQCAANAQVVPCKSKTDSRAADQHTVAICL